MFPTESIPDSDSIYRWFSKVFFVGDQLSPGAFWKSDNIGDGMSVNWSKYSSLEHTMKDAEKNTGKKRRDFGVFSLVVEDVRTISGLQVNHAPSSRNRAHSLVVGDLSTKNRLNLMKICKVEIKPPIFH